MIRFATVHNDSIQVTDLLHRNVKPSIKRCTAINIKRWSGLDNKLRYPPALARVSQSLRHDALTYFYKRNTFKGEFCSASGMPELLTWLRNVGSARTTLVQLFVQCGKAETDGYDVEKCAARLRDQLDAESFGSYELSRTGTATFKLVFHA